MDLVDSHGHRLYSLLAKLTANRDAADELLQDLFVRILKTTGVADAPNAEAYLFRAAINLAFDWRKRARRHPISRCSKRTWRSTASRRSIAWCNTKPSSASWRRWKNSPSRIGS